MYTEARTLHEVRGPDNISAPFHYVFGLEGCASVGHLMR